MRGSKVIPKRRFQLVLIKPSHYGDDGYVIRWWRSMISSNSLASLYGIAVDSAARGVLGCACRKLNPGILMMQSAQDWATKNVPGAIDGARDRCIFLEG
jgi:hypothetical protein